MGDRLLGDGLPGLSPSQLMPRPSAGRPLPRCHRQESRGGGGEPPPNLGETSTGSLEVASSLLPRFFQRGPQENTVSPREFRGTAKPPGESSPGRLGISGPLARPRRRTRRVPVPCRCGARSRGQECRRGPKPTLPVLGALRSVPSSHRSGRSGGGGRFAALLAVRGLPRGAGCLQNSGDFVALAGADLQARTGLSGPG